MDVGEVRMDDVSLTHPPTGRPSGRRRADENEALLPRPFLFSRWAVRSSFRGRERERDGEVECRSAFAPSNTGPPPLICVF